VTRADGVCQAAEVLEEDEAALESPPEPDDEPLAEPDDEEEDDEDEPDVLGFEAGVELEDELRLSVR
jgi:hypothetical protein